MIQERKEEFANELRTATEQGDSVKQWRRNFRRDYKQQIEEEGLDFKTFFDEIVAASREDATDNREIINRMNSLLKFIRDDDGNELSYDKLRTIEVNDTVPNRKLIEETGMSISILESQVDSLIKEAKEAGLPNTEIVEEIFERASSLLATQDDSGLEDEIQMKLEDFFQDLNQINVKLAKDRAKMYRFWKRVNKEYPKFIEAIDDFEEACQGTPFEEGVKKLVENKPSNYVIKVRPQSITLDKKEIRLFDILESLGGRIDSKSKKEWATRRQIAQDKMRGDKDYDWTTGREKYPHLDLLGDEAIDHVRELSYTSYDIDPIMAHIWKTLDTPIAMGELNYFTRRLGELQVKAGPVAAKKLEDKILQLKAEASAWDEDAYLPMGDWLLNFFKEIKFSTESIKTDEGSPDIQQFDKAAKDTEKWFEDLQELLFEKQTDSYAEYPVEQKPDFPGEYGAPHTMATKVTGAQERTLGRGVAPKLDPERSQGLLEPKMKKISSNMETALDNLKKALNRYYFQPLDSGYFIKSEASKYKIQEGGMEKVIPSIDTLVKPILSSGSTMGQAYKMLRYEFGDSNAIQVERELLDGAIDALDNLTLVKLTNFFKEANQGKKHENWAEYIDAVEDAVGLLDKLFDDTEKSNRVWAARAIANTLERRTEPDEDGHQWALKDVKLFGQNITNLIDDDLHQDPISNLVTLLQSDAIGPYIAKKENYQQKEAKRLKENIDKLLDVLLTFTKAMTINHAILNVHDAIRKMEGKPIEYGFLRTDDVEDMDYLINKIYTDYKLETNAMEINSIVKSVTSHDKISKQYGITTEVVYAIKGLCR